MTGRSEPADSRAPAASAPRGIGTVLVAIREGAEGRTSAVWADLEGGTRTVVAGDPGSLRLLGELECSVMRNGSVRPAASPTAGTLAALAEARRVCPRVDPWIGESPPTGGRSRLPRPIEELPMPVGDVLRGRRSVRSFAPLDTIRLSTLLYHSARVRETWAAPDGYPASSRASPSAGGRHPIDLLVIASALEGPGASRLAAGSPYLFDPLSCELVELAGPRADAFRESQARAAELLGSRPSAILAMMARPMRTFSRYRGGMSLIYRDAGALLATVGFVASALRLACCPLATVTPPADGLDPESMWLDVGGVALGGVAAEGPMPAVRRPDDCRPPDHRPPSDARP